MQATTIGAGETPATINDLRAVLAHEQASGRSGRRAIDVLAGLLDRPHDTAMHSITRLAEMQGVHASTLTRLAHNLGYSGFSEFQSVFKNHVSGGDHFYTRQAGGLLKADQDVSDVDKPKQLVDRITNNVINNIQRTQQDIDFEQLVQAAQQIAKARRVRTHGLRVTHGVACYLSYGLGWLRSDVSLLDGADHGAAPSLAQLEEGDVLVAFSCAPYTRRTVDTASMAAKHGVNVIAITDSHSSRLSAVAHSALIAPVTGAFISNSVGAIYVLAETLVALVAQELGDDALSAVERHEALIFEEKIEL